MILLSIIILLMFPMSPGLDNGNPLKSFSERAAASQMSFSYDYVTNGTVPLKGQGKVVVQDASFILLGDGLDVRCDGKSVWTMDSVAKEVVVDAVGSDCSDYVEYPALLLASLEENFKEIDNEEVFVDGKPMTMIELKPVASSKLKRLKLFFRGNIPVAANITVKDGTVTHFNIKDLKFGKKTSGDGFFFDPATLDSSWIITDLR